MEYGDSCTVMEPNSECAALQLSAGIYKRRFLFPFRDEAEYVSWRRGGIYACFASSVDVCAMEFFFFFGCVEYYALERGSFILFLFLFSSTHEVALGSHYGQQTFCKVARRSDLGSRAVGTDTSGSSCLQGPYIFVCACWDVESRGMGWSVESRERACVGYRN